MSDYLHNLVARTFSLEAGVRPQLRSAFEPAPLHGGFSVSVDSESETMFESISSAPRTSPAPLPLIVSTPVERIPSQESLNVTPEKSPRRDEPPPPPTDRVPSMKVKVLQPVIDAPPGSIRENSRAVSSPAVASRPDSIPMPRHLRTAPRSDTVHPAAAVVPHQTVETKEPRVEGIASIAIRSLAPAATVFSPSPLSVPTSDAPSPAAEARSQTVESEERRSERFAVAAIRPVARAAPAFSPSLPPAMAPPPPTIHVTIGRVEIRAVTTSAPTARTTLPATSPKISLDDYLKQRNGGRA